MVLINNLTPTQTHVWLFEQTPVTDRAYPSAGLIFGPFVLQHDEKVGDKHPRCPTTSDEWRLGLSIYLNSKPNSRRDGNIPQSFEPPPRW